MELQLQSQNLVEELQGINTLKINIVKQCDLSIILCRNLLSKFKKEVVIDGFKDEDSEIDFFKNVKQAPLYNLVYYFELKSLEIRFPKGDEERQRKYIIKKLNKFNKFFVDNLDFVQYMEQDKTYLDEHYFTMKFYDELNITHSKYYFRDPEFSTSHDLLLAKLFANQKLIDYLEWRLTNLGNSKSTNYPTTTKQLNWTGSKTDMTELGYALKYQGAINNGNANVNEIIRALEQVFNFDSGDPYKNFSEMRYRKKSRVKFLDELSTGLLSKMKDVDE